MAADPRMLQLLSYYREAELRGATLLLRLLNMTQGDSDAQINLAKHVADETRHAWLWTRRITETGGTPVTIVAGYQARLGRRIMPRTLTDLFALTIVVEERALARYREHAGRASVDLATQRVLLSVSKDEFWHIGWLRQKFEKLLEHDPGARQQAMLTIDRYRRIEEEVYGALCAHEMEVFREDMDDPNGRTNPAHEVGSVTPGLRPRC